MQDKIVEYYTNTYEEDDRLLQDNRHKLEFYNKLRLYRNYIDLYKPKRIMDTSCGTGIYSLVLAKVYPDIEFVACDIVPKHIEILNEKIEKENIPNLKAFVCANEDITEDKFGVFDLVFVAGAIYHTEDDETAKKIIRVAQGISKQYVFVDFLPCNHDWLQEILKNKKRIPFEFEDKHTENVFTYRNCDAMTHLLTDATDMTGWYTTDFNIRYAYKDFNMISDEAFAEVVIAFDYLTGQSPLGSIDTEPLIDMSEHAIMILKGTHN